MFPIPNKSRVVFLGDSLVAVNQTLTHIFHHYRTHHPEAGIQFYNCGISGATAGAMQLYLKEDTLLYAPTHIVLAVGINDSRRNLLAESPTPQRDSILQQAYNHYRNMMTRLCKEILDYGISLTLCTPAPYAEHQAGEAPALRGGYALTAGYADFCRSLARELNIPLCDYHKAMTERLQAGEILYSDDRTHPNPTGYRALAEIFLAHCGQRLCDDLAVDNAGFPAEVYDSWFSLVRRQRNMFTGDWLVARNHGESIEEKLHYVREYADRDLGPQESLKHYATAYLEEKPFAAELLEQIISTTKSLASYDR